MSSVFGDKIKITVFGQSHSEEMGAVIDGLPAGEKIDEGKIAEFMSRRAPGRNSYSTPRKESDRVKIVSGLFEGKTCGAPLCGIIENKDTRSQDYESLRKTPRPSHADYPAYVKYGGNGDYRGGGNFSGRLTAPLCFAGAVLMQLLERKGIRIGARIKSIGAAFDDAIDCDGIDEKILDTISVNKLPTLCGGERMLEEIEKAKAEGDSLGGMIECFVFGLGAGLGEPVFDGLENLISQAVFAVPAVKGIEFGAGFAFCDMKGSEANDAYCVRNGKITAITNSNGGILGGLSTGMPLRFSVAIKPTPSIAKEQNSVKLDDLSETKISITGRHDPCIVPRAVPCIEAAAAIALAQFVV